jgi:XTP/dITP diphosphohydrolase
MQLDGRKLLRQSAEFKFVFERRFATVCRRTLTLLLIGFADIKNLPYEVCSSAMELLIATTNAGKLAEIAQVFKELPVKIVPLDRLDSSPQVLEDGKTFEENALKKARILAEFSGYITLADDSGLSVDALDGAPGIHSARYSGADANDARNNEKLLQALAGVPEEKRSARFVCVLALCVPTSLGKKEWTVRESCEGRIALSPKGQNGFGYDPLFFYPPFGKTFGEIDRDTKATVSHRGKALKKLAQSLSSVIDLGQNLDFKPRLCRMT